jgi:large subunit ribosomal protein L30
MIAIIRIRGKVKLKKTIEETFYRLGLRRKYSCILISEKDKVKKGMLKKVQDHVAFGEIEKPVLIRLIDKRAQPIEKGKKINSNKIALEILNGKKPEDLGIKGFFRLHPPRKGLKSSKQKFPKGNLGNYGKEINKLIERML